MKYSFLIIAILSFLSIADAQTHEHIGKCGLNAEMDSELIKRTRIAVDRIASEGFERSADVRYVPITFHLIHRDDGSGGVSDLTIRNAICNSNAYYEAFQADIQYIIHDINHINSTDAFENHWDETNLLNAHKVGTTVNIYVPESANYGSATGIAGYYRPGRDWIVVGMGNLGGRTMAHELGHYFALPHPFRGWDNEPYDPNVHGVQVGTYSPGGFGQNQILNELADGSNCAIAGDLICDTPADYQHSSQSWGCNYAGGAKDPNGQLIDPDETNVMAYFLSCSPNTMSQGQIDVMHADIDQRIQFGNLEYIVWAGEGPVGTSSLIQPIDDEIIYVGDEVTFEWAAAENAEAYEVTIDWVPTFALTPIKFTTEDLSFTYSGADLLPNKKYFWKVTPLSQYDECTDATDNGTFKTEISASTKDLNFSNALSIFPNPTLSSSTINVLWNDQQGGVDWEIRNAIGQLMFSKKEGRGAEVLPMDNLSPGFYFISGTAGDQRVVKKFLIN